MPRPTSTAVVDVLAEIVVGQPRRGGIHVIAANVSTHRTKACAHFVTHPNCEATTTAAHTRHSMECCQLVAHSVARSDVSQSKV